jgi:hypothetical protein
MRKVSGKKYLLAFILTLVIFAGGVVLGILIEGARLNDAKQLTLTEKVNLQSLQLQQQYIESGLADCSTLNRVLEANIDQLVKKMSTVTEYEKRSILNEEEFNLQLRDYFLTEIQYLLISEEIDRRCPQDNVKILYFYDEGATDTQGEILDYLKKKFGHQVLVFSLNARFQDEPLIDILLTSYNISQFPSVVVGGEVFQGHTSVETLFAEICNDFDHFSDEPEVCIKFRNR